MLDLNKKDNEIVDNDREDDAETPKLHATTEMHDNKRRRPCGAAKYITLKMCE